MVPRKQVDALLDSHIDIGFLARNEAQFEEALALEPVVEVGLVGALPPTHPLTRLRRVPIEKLANESLVFFKRSSAPAMFDWIRDLCRAKGLEPRITKQSDQAQAILDSIAAGIGVSILPEFFQRYHSEVVFRPLAPEPPKIELCMAWRRHDTSEILQSLKATLRQAFREQSR
jgi:DNA-binding transcriptional LysR family regulator